MKFAIYDRATGRIHQTMECTQDTALLQEDESLAVLEIPEMVENDFWFINAAGEAEQRRGDYTLEDLPLPCRLLIEDEEYWVTEQPEDFEFDAPGVYDIKVYPESPAYLPKEFQIENPA